MTDGQLYAEHMTHLSLVTWGMVLLRGAKGTEPKVEEGEPIRKRIWTAAEEARAWETDRRVNLFDAKQRIILRTFYRGREAEYWHELEPDKRKDVLIEMCREANARWRTYCREAGWHPYTIRWQHLDQVREQCIRALVVANAQRLEDAISDTS